MMQKAFQRIARSFLLIMGLIGYHTAFAQQVDCEAGKNYSVSNSTVHAGGKSHSGNDKNSVQLTIGNPFWGQVGSFSQGRSVVGGFYSYYQLEPQAPQAKASEGEFLDRIVVEWEVIDDRTGPPVTEQLTKIYRNGLLLATVPLSQTTYQDYNVFPGEFYTYEIVTTNTNDGSGLRDSWTLPVVGFLNPNGRITGNVESRNGVPVDDVKVTLTPNLGRSLLFDGVNDYVYFPDTFAINSLYTIEGWFRNITVQNQTLFVVQDTGGAKHPLIKVFLDANGHLVYHHDINATGNAKELVSRDPYNLSSQTRDWHHFAAVRDSAHLYLYVDGQRVAEQVLPFNPVANIGRVEMAKDGSQEFTGFYHGYLDEIRMWSVPRSREEIRKFDDITLNGTESGLQAYWKLDEQFGEKIFDFASKPNVDDRLHGFICEVERSAFVSPVQLGAYTDIGGDYIISGIYYGSGTTFSARPSKETPIGVALDFDGENDYISFNTKRLTFEDAFTLEGWFKTGVDGKLMTIFEATDAATNQLLMQLQLDSVGKISFISQFDGVFNSITSTASYNDEFWYHYAITQDQHARKLYINGTEVGSLSGASIDPVLARFVIGRSNPKEVEIGYDHFEGSLDEMRLWSVARSFEQIGGTMKQIIQGDEQGIVEDEDLMAYWMFSEAAGTIVGDRTPNGQAGTFTNPQLITVGSGDQIVTNWNGDDIPLDVEFFTHEFEPNARNATLDPSNISVDRVDFTDISQLGMSGFIKMANTDCFAPDIEVLVNGEAAFPPISTDENGKFVAEFEPGSTGNLLSASTEKYAFAPSFIELPKVTRPIAGLSFNLTTTYTISGKVGGGDCRLPIGESKVVIQSLNGCFTDTVDVDAQSAEYTFEALPPLVYSVAVIHESSTIQNYFNTQGAQEVDLRNGDTTNIDFVYYAPLMVEVEYLDTEPSCNSQHVMRMGRFYKVRFKAFEEYDGQQCFTSSGNITIQNQAGINEEDTTMAIVNGFATYRFQAGVPNLTAPHLKSFSYVATASSDRQAIGFEEVFITGYKTLTNTFTTKSPEIPLFVLRDPPGDNSSAFVSEETEVCRSVTFTRDEADMNGVEINEYLGPDLNWETGIGFAKSFEVDIIADLTFSTQWNEERGRTEGNEVCISFNQTYATSDDEYFVGKDADLFVGAAFNVVYGTNRFLELDAQCNVVTRDSLMITSNGIASNYTYTRGFIENSLIPDLYTLNDSTSALAWQTILNTDSVQQSSAFINAIDSVFNGDSVVTHAFEIPTPFPYANPNQTYLKYVSIEVPALSSSLNADDFKFNENISFSAGANISKEFSTTSVSNTTYSLVDEDITSFAGQFGVTFNGFGLSAGPVSESRITYTSESNIQESNSRTVGYTLSDNDPGDNFFVSVAQDHLGNPTFKLNAGESMCPWEQGTAKRQAVEVQPLSPTSVVNIPSDEPAVFNLRLINNSETATEIATKVQVGQESNPNGALIKINGVAVESGIGLLLNPGEPLDVVITIEKGPDAFVYEDLEIIYTSECEDDYWAGIGLPVPEPFADYTYLSVEFVETCSKVDLVGVEEGWLINQSFGNSMNLALEGYDLDRTELDDIRFQYRPKVEGQPYVNAVTFIKDSLDPESTDFIWDVSAVPDGEYEIRAISFCSGDILPRSSEVFSGVIDRSAPIVLGTPTPIDAILEQDDQITITFEEELNCGVIISLPQDVSLLQGSRNNVDLVNTERSDKIEKTVTCNGNQLVITPDIQNKFIEGQVLRVDLLGLEDLFGNIQTEPISWEFLVNRNPIEWLDGDVQEVVLEGEELVFTRRIKNNGAFDIDFNLSGELSLPELNTTPLPSWISAQPLDGTIPPGGTQSISFTISDQIGGGFYEDVVVAENTGGAPELNFDVRVLCPEPAWNLNPGDFTNSMPITANLIIENENSTDIYDRVAAYVGDELRGIGELTYVPELDVYQLYLLVYSNDFSGDRIRFEIWDASSCRLFPSALEQYFFNADNVIGTPTSPVTITADTKVFASVPITMGWNWVSFNLDMDDKSLNSVLEPLEATANYSIKSQDSAAFFLPNVGWVGPLAQHPIDVREMFQLKTDQADVLEFTGYEVDIETVTIPIQTGWNWVSYLPKRSAEINEALESLNDKATTGDLIKSQSKFAQYVENIGWLGSLDFMSPFQGYKLYFQNSDVLAYPITINTGRYTVFENENTYLPKGWDINPKQYQHSMSITGEIADNPFVEHTGKDLIGVFVNDELRGFGAAKDLDVANQQVFFISPFSNQTANEQLEFKYFHAESGGIYALENQLYFQANAAHGLPTDPYLFRLGELIGFDLPMATDAYRLEQNIPNPFTDQTEIRYELPQDTFVEMEVVDILGKSVRRLMTAFSLKGVNRIVWDGKDESGQQVPSGVYILHMRSGDFQQSIRMVVQAN